MDDVRDIKTYDQLSRTLDSQTVRTSPFGGNSSAEKAYRRAERLISAVHLITNHLPETEPSRKAIREKGLRLLTELLDMRNEMRGVASTKTRAVQSTIRELISLIRIITISGFISYHNAELVIEALDELGNFLNASRRSTLSEDVALSRETLLPAQEAHKKQISMTAGNAPEIHSTQPLSDIKDKSLITDDIRDTKDRPFVHTDISSIGNRGRNIMDTLRSGGVLGIKEVCAHFPEYSEKMIQRELASLVSAGLVKKMGLKRWSKYALI